MTYASDEPREVFQMRNIAERFMVGTAASAATVSITLSNVNEWLRLAGGVGSLVILVLTVVSWLQKIRRDAMYDRASARYDRREAHNDRQDAKVDRQSAKDDRQGAREDRQDAKDARA